MHKFEKYGLVTTRDVFRDAMAHRFAVPAFNFFNMETLTAIVDAARATHSPVILAASQSAIKYMGPDMLMAMIAGLKLTPADGVALHLDHGSSFDACAAAIDMGFSSVMIDASGLPFDQNVEISRRVAEYAHTHGCVAEAELGQITGIEDETTFGTVSHYTDPARAIEFVNMTGIDSLAVAIGTAHGAYKRKSPTEELRFDILGQIAEKLPDFPLVLHGASTIPDAFVRQINENGGKISDARGIPVAQLRRAVEMNVCKINVDSDSRLAFTAGVREKLATDPSIFNPRDYLGVGKSNVYENCIDEIRNIMNSENHL